jgi:hypothetical protein
MLHITREGQHRPKVSQTLVTLDADCDRCHVGFENRC